MALKEQEVQFLVLILTFIEHYFIQDILSLRVFDRRPDNWYNDINIPTFRVVTL